MPFENDDQNQEPQGRAINLRFSRDTLLLVGALGFLALALILAFLIPTGPESADDRTPTGNATLVAGGPSVTPGGPANADETPVPVNATGGPYPAPNNGYPEPGALRETSAPGLTPPPSDVTDTPTGPNLEATDSPGAQSTSATASSAQTPVVPGAATQPANPYPGPGNQPAPTTDIVRVTATSAAGGQPGQTLEPTATQAVPTQAPPPTQPPPPTQAPPPPPQNPTPGEPEPTIERPTRAPPTETPIPEPTRPPVDLIRGTVRWTPANGPIIIGRNLAVPRGATLIIEPGTEVKIAPGVSIFVDGSLQSLGRPDAPVRISSLTGQRWEGIFGNPRSAIQLDTTYVSGGGSGGTLLTSDGGELLVRGSRFNDNGGTIYVTNSRLEMRDSEIAGNDMPHGSALNASYDTGNFVILHGNRISGNRLDPGAPNVRIASTTPYDTLNLDIQGNYIVGGGGGNLLLFTDGPLQGQLVCNTLRNDSIGLDIRSETKQIPGFNLLVRNNFIDDHTPAIVPTYLRYGIGRAAASEVVLDMRQNWWGDPSGPYHPETNQEARGEAVGVNIDYSDWLTAPPPCAPQP